MLTGLEEGKKVPYSLGHFFMAIDINAFTDPDDFKRTTGNILRDLRASRKMPGQTRIYTAGEKEYDTWMKRKDEGIPFNEDLLREYRELCEQYDLEEFLNEF
jgi:LDH2 family malate/lactate/ureidoglycolate dehydrogenase